LICCRYGAISLFTYLRLDADLLDASNWPVFTQFVSQMHNI
jgi:hypothetical protein